MKPTSAPPALAGLTILLAAATLIAVGVLVARGWLDRPLPVQIAPLPLDPSIKVAVRGAVVSPGVYSLREGDRVEDALRAAGGLAADADERAINPAARVVDEQEIWVPRRGEPATAPASPAVATVSAGRVNLNTATLAQLVALPGIAELTATRIIESRERVGPFRRVEELRERGIMNERNFELVKDRVTAN